MNLKKAKRLRLFAKSEPSCQTEQIVHTFSKRRGQQNCVVVWDRCLRGIYKNLKKEHNERLR